ncbi:hypothetical protein ACTGJ9_018480 [Bradyrhizobium sp. RDM12]
MQSQMFDPRITPTATAEMLADGDLHDAINAMRRGVVRQWPYVERLCKIDDALVWAVDDEGERYVVVRGLVWTIPDLVLAERKIRNAALEAFARLDDCWSAA